MGEEIDDLVSRFIAVMDALNKTMRYRVPDEKFGQMNLNQMHMLRMISFEPDIAQKDIAERLKITPAAVSMAIRGLEDQGLVERAPDPTDARQMRLALGKHGRDFIERTQRDRHESISEFLSVLSREELEMILGALERALASRKRPDMTDTH